jgi:hypothetical protein
MFSLNLNPLFAYFSPQFLFRSCLLGFADHSGTSLNETNVNSPETVYIPVTRKRILTCLLATFTSQHGTSCDARHSRTGPDFCTDETRFLPSELLTSTDAASSSFCMAGSRATGDRLTFPINNKKMVIRCTDKRSIHIAKRCY